MSASTSLLRCRREISETVRATLGNSRRGLATVTDVQQNPRLAVGILLNRAPIITRTPSDLEREFYKYQRRIRRALHNPFPTEFYFKQGSLLEAQFADAEIARERRAFGDDFVKDAKEKAARLMKVETGGEEEKPMPRRTLADEKKDIKSLHRHCPRNLYLLVKGKPDDKYEWRFPKGYVGTGEFLHEAAKRELHAECGPNMNTWVVGKRPIGFFEDADDLNEKLFFYKAHIFAGQAVPIESRISDFAWLTKEEIEPRVSKEYWEKTKDMLSDF